MDSREIKGATSELSRGVSVHHMKEREEPDISAFSGGLCVRKTTAGHLPGETDTGTAEGTLSCVSWELPRGREFLEPRLEKEVERCQ